MVLVNDSRTFRSLQLKRRLGYFRSTDMFMGNTQIEQWNLSGGATDSWGRSERLSFRRNVHLHIGWENKERSFPNDGPN